MKAIAIVTKLDSEGKQGGVSEPGWAGPWSARSSPQSSFQKKVVHEGDGALFLSKSSTSRRLAEAQAGLFQVEMFVQVPAAGGFGCYLKSGDKPWASDGPIWGAGDGKFGVLGDDEKRTRTSSLLASYPAHGRPSSRPSLPSSSSKMSWSVAR